MADEKPAVETKDQTAASDVVVDYQAQMAAKDAEIARIRTERDNYKTGLLKAKGKSVGDDDEPDQYEIMRQIAREEALKTQEAQAMKEKDAIIAQMAKDLSEAKLALKNKGGTSTARGSSTEPTAPVGDNLLSDDQVNTLKAKGWDDAKIARYKATLLKNKR